MSGETVAALRVCSFESRRGSDMAALIERQGGVAFIAPSMREIPLDDNRPALAFAEALLAGRIDAVIFLTGVGAQTLMAAMETRFRRADLIVALDRACIIVRGPKPVVVLREWNVHVDHRAPEPNTWREVLAVLDEARVDLAGRTVAVQEYGRPSSELEEALAERGAEVVSVPVYRWTLPEDVGPLQEAVRQTIAGEFDVLLVTSAQQIAHVLSVADALGVGESWKEAARRCFIGSVGPAATEALQEAGLPPDLEPSHPKMGHLVVETLAAARSR